MATKKTPDTAPAAAEPEYVARAGGWGLTTEGVWVALDAPAAAPAD